MHSNKKARQHATNFPVTYCLAFLFYSFPHYWSAENGRTFKRYARLTGNEEYNIRGEHSLRGVLSMFFEDGTATCAYLYPYSVNGQKTDFADPYANDQDWGLCMNLE